MGWHERMMVENWTVFSKTDHSISINMFFQHLTTPLSEVEAISLHPEPRYDFVIALVNRMQTEMTLSNF